MPETSSVKSRTNGGVFEHEESSRHKYHGQNGWKALVEDTKAVIDTSVLRIYIMLAQ